MVKEQIEHFLRNVSMKNSEQKVMQMVADRFDGVTTSNKRYVKIGANEYRIEKNPDKGGWTVRLMDWKIGNDWRFFNEY